MPATGPDRPRTLQDARRSVRSCHAASSPARPSWGDTPTARAPRRGRNMPRQCSREHAQHMGRSCMAAQSRMSRICRSENSNLRRGLGSLLTAIFAAHSRTVQMSWSTLASFRNQPVPEQVWARQGDSASSSHRCALCSCGGWQAVIALGGLGRALMGAPRSAVGPAGGMG